MANYGRSDDDFDRDDGFGGRSGDTDTFALRRRGGKKRPPSFCEDPNFHFDYKDPQKLRLFLTERGKVVPRRISGLNAKQQRELTVAIRRARNIALLPYTTNH
jgi:small subunit ribosomal protein S18